MDSAEICLAHLILFDHAQALASASNIKSIFFLKRKSLSGLLAKGVNSFLS
jgi:hypothetical protein